MLSAYIEQLLARELDPAFARRARIILEHIHVKHGMKVLEAGCGRGFYEIALMQFRKRFTVYALDISDVYLKQAKEAIQPFSNSLVSVVFKKGDATHLPFPEKTFDRIICSEVLEHIPEDTRALTELYRVLKPGGTIFISVPHTPYPFLWDPLNFILERLFKIHVPARMWWLAGIWAGHMRLYSEDELTGKVKQAGLQVKQLWRTTHVCFPASHFLLYGIGKNLIERGIVGTSFNRFGPVMPRGILHKLVAIPFRFFDRFNTSTEKKGRYTNLVIQASRSV